MTELTATLDAVRTSTRTDATRSQRQLAEQKGHTARLTDQVQTDTQTHRHTDTRPASQTRYRQTHGPPHRPGTDRLTDTQTHGPPHRPGTDRHTDSDTQTHGPPHRPGTDRHTARLTDQVQTDTQTHRHTDTRPASQTRYRQTHGPPHRPGTDRHTDSQTHRHTACLTDQVQTASDTQPASQTYSPPHISV